MLTSSNVFPGLLICILVLGVCEIERNGGEAFIFYNRIWGCVKAHKNRSNVTPYFIDIFEPSPANVNCETDVFKNWHQYRFYLGCYKRKGAISISLAFKYPLNFAWLSSEIFWNCRAWWQIYLENTMNEQASNQWKWIFFVE